MELNLAAFYRIMAPRPAVLVTTVNKDGISNAAPFSFIMPISVDPPYLAIASQPKHHTMTNIKETGQFVINVMPEETVDKLYACSQKLPEGVSEIEESALTEKPSAQVKAPAIEEAIGFFECQLEWEKVVGDHVLIVGKVLRAFVKDEFVKEGRPNIIDAKPLMHVSGKEFAIAEKTLRAE